MAKPLLLLYFYLQAGGDNVGGLPRPGQRTANDLIERCAKHAQHIGYFAHLLFPWYGQGPLVIRPVPVRPVGFSMSEEIQLHQSVRCNRAEPAGRSDMATPRC